MVKWNDEILEKDKILRIKKKNTIFTYWLKLYLGHDYIAQKKSEV